MKKLTVAAIALAMTLKLLTGWAQFSLASLGSAYQMLGGSQAVSSLASSLVSSALKDPRLASLVKGKSVDPTATSSKMSDQLCSMLGGGCKAPLTNSQVAAAGKKLTPTQSSAITQTFESELSKVASDPLVREAVTKALGNKVPGVLAGLL